jgi:hypothetical protein
MKYDHECLEGGDLEEGSRSLFCGTTGAFALTDCEEARHISSSIASNPAEVRTEYLPVTCQARYLQGESKLNRAMYVL